MKNKYRTHNCGELNIKNVGEEVKIAGFVQTIRNLGKMMFIDLRDENGITQLVINEEAGLAEKCKDLNKECTITVAGRVAERSSKNDKLSTGEIEVVATDLTILGKCRANLPFEINVENQNVREDLRLEYRFLDLRNEKIHNNIKLRSKILKDMRKEMDKLGFTEIQTPILANSSPEGARDFLVPSRLHPGEFYALPQAPQQFKQLLMVSGFEKYYQIAPCFRDEDPRADRSPGEFYQLDFEMSFVEQDDVLNVIETVIPNVFKANSTWKVDDGPFVRIPYKEAMEKYGTDKPDLRNPLIISDLTDIFEGTEFKAFENKTVKAITVQNSEDKSRKFFDSMSEYAIQEFDAKGLAWVKVDQDMNLNGAEIETIKEAKDDYNDNDYNENNYYKKGKNNYKNDKYNRNDKYNNYNNNDKYYDKYYDNYNYNDKYNNGKYYKNSDKNYDNYGYKDYGGKKGYKGGYNDYNDYDYGKSYKKKNYYKGGYK